MSECFLALRTRVAVRTRVADGASIPTPDVLIVILEPNLRTRLSSADSSVSVGPEHDVDEYLVQRLRCINNHCGYDDGLPYTVACAALRERLEAVT